MMPIMTPVLTFFFVLSHDSPGEHKFELPETLQQNTDGMQKYD